MGEYKITTLSYLPYNYLIMQFNYWICSFLQLLHFLYFFFFLVEKLGQFAVYNLP